MKVSSPKDLPSLKQELKELLPAQISEVINNYSDFAEGNPPDDAKGFATYHSACKAALAHAEMLLKIAKWSEGNIIDDTSPDGIKKLLDEATLALNSTDEKDDYEYECFDN